MNSVSGLEHPGMREEARADGGHGGPARVRTWCGALAGVVLAGGLASPAAFATNGSSGGPPGGTLPSPAPLTVDGGSASAQEGSKVEFKIKLGSGNTAKGMPIRYSYKTQDGSAKAGADYRSVSGWVVFPSGVKKKSVFVQTFSDNIDESPGESFKLKFSNRQFKFLGRWWSSGTNTTITFTGKIREGSQVPQATSANDSASCGSGGTLTNC